MCDDCESLKQQIERMADGADRLAHACRDKNDALAGAREDTAYWKNEYEKAQGKRQVAEATVGRLCEAKTTVDRKLEAALNRVKQLEAALWIYADGENWRIGPDTTGKPQCVFVAIVAAGPQLAREVLKESRSSATRHFEGAETPIGKGRVWNSD